MMSLEERIGALIQLGRRLQDLDRPELQAIIRESYRRNPWFIPENTRRALTAVRDAFLEEENLRKWLSSYEIPANNLARKVGLVMAGNIPLVGLQDVLAVFVAGHHALIKLSDKDAHLLPFLLGCLAEIDPRTREYFQIVPQLKDFEAVIATGSDNSARYFEAYFGKYPHIIRRNRNGLAVLTGTENREELQALADDVFLYFGLGCRNVAKLYVPEDYSLPSLLEVFDEYEHLLQHNKYRNNFDYNLTLLLLNKEPHLQGKSILLKEDPGFQSRIGMLHYQAYRSREEVQAELQNQRDRIQCLAAAGEWPGLPRVAFGQTQRPSLSDYPDGVDTLAFLLSLNNA